MAPNKRLHRTALSRRTSAAPRAFRLTLRRVLFPAPARRVNAEPLDGLIPIEVTSRVE